jgi:hypothetical protein
MPDAKSLSQSVTTRPVSVIAADVRDAVGSVVEAESPSSPHPTAANASPTAAIAKASHLRVR